MNKEQFEAVLHSYISSVVSLLIEKLECNEDYAILEFMMSKTYAMLVDEESKLWHMSSLGICEMYLNERNGNFVIPEVY